MNKLDFFQRLQEKGITLGRDDKDGIVLKGDRSQLDQELISEIKAHKSDILRWLDDMQLKTRSRVIPAAREYIRVPLSYAQQRLWFLDKMHAGTSYNLPIAFNIAGRLDLNLLNQVFNAILFRHEIIRTVYVEDSGDVFQHILPFNEVKFNIALHDVSGLSHEKQGEEVKRLIDADVAKPFNLSGDLMARIGYVKKSEVSGVLLFNMHHIASDGWSIKILTKEFFALYNAYAQGRENPLPPLTIQYSDYALWQREYLTGSVLEKQLSFWEKHLENVSPIHSIPLDKKRPEFKQHQGARVGATLSASTAQGLIALAKQHSLTPFMLLQGALSLLIACHGNNPDIVMGTPIANRLQSELEPLIGFFANTLVLRVNTIHETLDNYFKHVRQVHLDAQSNQDIPFEKLVEQLKLPRSISYTPLVQILVTIDSDYGINFNTQGDVIVAPDLEISVATDVMASRFDLEVRFGISDQGVSIRWLYDVSLFELVHIEQLNDHFCRLLDYLSGVASGQETYLRSLPMLSDQEIQYMVFELNKTQNKYPKEKCIHEFFEYQANLCPDNIAVIFNDKKLTYKQLNEKSNQLAHYLREQHTVTPDTLVGLCVERSLEMVIGILGILKAGGAYVPLDPFYPQQRLSYMLDDARLTLVLTQSEVLHAVAGFTGEIILINGLGELTNTNQFTAGCSIDNLPITQTQLSSRHLAYMIYTSGSTGKPKGVLVEHRSVINYLTGVKNYLNNNIKRSFISTSLNFDATVTSLFGAWLCGGSLVVIPYGSDILERLRLHLASPDAGLFKLTPSHLLGLELQENILTPHVIVVGGEPFTVELAKRIAKKIPNACFINEYGPTEATVGCCYGMFSFDDLGIYEGVDIHIGNPIQNAQLIIMDQDKRILPQGTCGELYIGGDCLARGYLNLPELTAERFVANPFYDESKSNSSKYLYRTGDLVRHLSNGKLEFIGRTDEQIKIRGYRIEPGEIESQLNKLDGVNSAMVMVKGMAEQRQLVAYVKSEDPLKEEDQAAFIMNIKNALCIHLPDYMVPAVFLCVNSWPFTPSGKIDKKILPEPDFAAWQLDFQLPQTETERILVEIWSELLGVDKAKISTTTNFFELGGHSLLLVKLVFKLRQKFAIKDIDINELLQKPQIQALSRSIEYELNDKFNALPVDEIEW